MTKVLAGDIGGTTTRLGVFDAGSPRPELVATEAYETTEFAGIAEMAAAFLREADIDARSLGAACFGAAGPVQDGIVQLTNSPMLVDASVIAGGLGIARVHLLNDLEALAYAVPVLGPGEVHVLQEGRANPSGAIAVIAAGTGLGEAVLHEIHGRRVATPSEGGRADFAARTDRDILVLKDLRARRGRAAVEDVVSGSGLVNIHRALHPSGCDASINFDDHDAPSAVSASALEGRCKACFTSLMVLVEAYGAEAGNLALRTVATGGVYVGGGIAPKILAAMTNGWFMAAFREKAPFTAMLTAMPVKVILNDDAGLLGAANFCFLA